MKLYKTIIEATIEAARTCSEWKLTNGDATYNVEEIEEIAGIYDVASPNVSEATYYCVFPDGEIDVVNTETKIYSPIFIPSNQSQPSISESITSESPSDDQIRFCTNCGSPVTPDALFCDNCGARVR